MKPLTLRAAQGFCVVGITAAVALAIPRWARPDLYPDEQGWGGLAHAMRRAFFHFDFGVACGWSGCPRVRDMWLRGYAADVWMLLGTVAIGVGAGVALGLWCAGRADSGRARVVESAAVVLYCAPVYVLGLGVLLLFHSTFGTLPLPYFFDAAPIRASPLWSPWDWFRTLLVPCLVAAAPLAAMCARLVIALLREQQGTDHLRTAIAKGRSAQAGDPPPRRPVRGCGNRVAGRRERARRRDQPDPRRAGLLRAGLLPAHVEGDRPLGGLPGRLQGGKPPTIDLEMLVGISIWASVFVVVLSLAMEFVLLRLDPRVRAVRQL